MKRWFGLCAWPALVLISVALAWRVYGNMRVELVSKQQIHEVCVCVCV